MMMDVWREESHLSFGYFQFQARAARKTLLSVVKMKLLSVVMMMFLSMVVIVFLSVLMKMMILVSLSRLT